MSAIPKHTTATTETAWDGPANEARLKLGGSEAYYRSAYAWQDPEGDATKKNAFRYIHHMVADGGEVGAANVMACVSGIGVLNGARGGTTIPMGDKRGVYDHLAGHLRDAGKQPPDFKGEDGEEFAARDVAVLAPGRAGRIAAAFPNLWNWIAASAWAIVPERGLELLAALELRGSGVAVNFEAARSISRAPVAGGKGVAVIPLYGPLAQRGALCGTSVQDFMATLSAAMSDPNIAAVVLDVDSPGGNTYGIDEASSAMYAMRGSKPLIAVANSVMASAAYWLASAADEVVVTPGGDVGSIGVYAVHTDQSGAAAQKGVTNTIISAGKYKAEHSPFGPLTEESKASLQKMVDEKYGMFTAAVARNRRTSPDVVGRGYGEGRTVGAKEAVAVGLADRVGTLDETLARLGVGASQANRVAAAAATATPEGYGQTLERLSRHLETEKET
jgi:signal peptide peptidase SppA